MKDIAQIDENFRIADIQAEDLRYYSVLEEPFSIHGLYRPRELQRFTRMPDSFRENPAICEGTRELIPNTAGGRIRFATNSPYIAVLVELEGIMVLGHMAATAHSGMDIMVCKRGKNEHTFKKVCMPTRFSEDADRFYKGFLKFEDYDQYDEHEVMLHMPLYNSVKSVYVGIKEGCSVFSPVEYKVKKPVYFYGASITQGGCASRPANNYPNFLSRWLDCDFVNLGFSGSAAGEPEMAEYLASQDASAIVLDLDMRLRDPEVFRNTFEPFYRKLRSINKEVPIITMSFPKYPKIHHPVTSNYRDHVISNRIILDTCLKAWNEGDEKLWYLDGETMFGEEDQECCTVDYSHPNDLGFYRMAQALLPLVKRAIRDAE